MTSPHRKSVTSVPGLEGISSAFFMPSPLPYLSPYDALKELFHPCLKEGKINPEK